MSCSDGVLTDAAGDIIYKPCTKSEADFYETARREHPEFYSQAMPELVGNLTLATPEQKEALKQQDPMSINAALQAQEGTAQDLIDSKARQIRAASTVDTKSIFGKKLDAEHGIVLENVCGGFVRPNVLDVKLGARLWDDDARPEKRQRLDKASMESTSHELGFRIAGMRVWKPDADNSSQVNESKGSFKIYDKFYGRNLTKDNIGDGFKDFFYDGAPGKKELSPLRKAVLEACEAEVLGLEQQLQKVETRIYSASILFVYEGDNKALRSALDAFEELERKLDAKEEPDHAEGGEEGDGSEDEEDMPKVYSVKLIDFAHAHWTPGQGPDENMLKGVRSVRHLLKEILGA